MVDSSRYTEKEKEMNRQRIHHLIKTLTDAHLSTMATVIDGIDFEDIEKEVPDPGATVKDKLRGWSHELWSHHRELVLARGRLDNDNPH